MSLSQGPRIRSLYRSLLRELPPRPTPSPLQCWVRDKIASPSSSSSSSTAGPASTATARPTTAPTTMINIEPNETTQEPTSPAQPIPVHMGKGFNSEQISQAEQAVLYLRAQSTYVVLLERYNPGVGSVMDEEERVRLSAKRVGMSLPVEFKNRLK